MSNELSVTEILEKLTLIETELFNNIHLIEHRNYKLINIAIAALKYFTANIETLKFKEHLYFANIRVNNQSQDIPIHLEDLPANPEHKKIQFLNALPRLFIASYEIVKNTKKWENINTFAGKFDGNCIDARTRAAFDYAAAIYSPPTFQDVLERCSKKIQDAGKEPSYYRLFIEIANHYWCTPYSKDNALTSPCQEDGIFDTRCFPLLA